MDKKPKKFLITSAVGFLILTIAAGTWYFYEGPPKTDEERDKEIETTTAPLDTKIIEPTIADELEALEADILVSITPPELRKEHTPNENDCPDPFPPLVLEVPEGFNWSLDVQPKWLDVKPNEGSSGKNEVQVDFNCLIDDLKPHTEHVQLKVNVVETLGDKKGEFTFDVFVEIMPQ